MKNTIVFCLRADNEESYGEIADFIYKREHRAVMSNSDVRRITYNYYLQDDTDSSKNWCKKILADLDEFKKIREPHNIRNITEEYEIIYCICVDKASDIINLSDLYLIKLHYSDLNILVLFPECDDNRYYTVSQFLYSVAMQDRKFYNECYFMHQNSLKRAQMKDVKFSRTFTPLQVIDHDNVKRLFRQCGDLITADYIKSISLHSSETIDGYDDLVQGSTKILCETMKESLLLSDSQYIRILQKMDVLAYILLCYVVYKNRLELNPVQLEKYAVQMQQYSNAIKQLAENIVYHAKTGRGIIAFRLHDKKSPYMNNKYKIEDIVNSYLEIIVSDFCRDNLLGNIADNFVANLVEEDVKNTFKGLQPRSFFEHEHIEKFKNAWSEFYRNPDNIGKHFGLRIFQSIVSTYGGVFGAESHCDYINHSGDSYLSYQGSESSTCMPGTRYHIALPIENVQRIIRKQDLSLDSGIGIDKRIRDYLNYTTGNAVFVNMAGIHRTQQEKNEQIRGMADHIKREIEKSNKDIIYIALSDIGGYAGELAAKALITALFQTKQDLVIVLYQCAEELKKSIFDVMRIFYCNADIEGMFYGRKMQIVMYSENYEEIVLDLASAMDTDSINAYIAHMKCIASVEGYLNPDGSNIDLDRGALHYIPCDILHKVEINGKMQTLFEHYTESILKNSIQESEFGCQLEHTHMRLGSTIHIDRFYEAEILFGNRLFVSRFALLLVKDMREELADISKLSLYGYGTYSETVLVQMIEMIRCLYPADKKDVDYIILEREEERRGFLHTDRIRYNRAFKSKDERIEYFKDRKVAIVVLINSTLKTHMRLINLFREENNINTPNADWLIRNYAVLLVGNVDSNAYWKLAENNIVDSEKNISPSPRYFIQVQADYQEPSECEQCFPDNPVAEVPLIEVNAASTIPNQAFGIVEHQPTEKFNLNYDMIFEEEEKLGCLKEELTYGHVHRNENHFLYYFKTENICIKQKDVIRESLYKWKSHLETGNGLQYNIIVAPMHFSNAGFVELVNNAVFDGNAILLRIDFDKEYRCNAYTKYSYLRNYIDQLSTMPSGGRVRVHFVDDAIISGRTFHRAKTLISSIFNVQDRKTDLIEITIFDKVFVLVDRNSSASRNQYVKDERSDFYAFIRVNISSLRNYGDSCVYCNLKKEANLLFDTASTKSIAEYWRYSADKKFRLFSLEEYAKEKPEQNLEKHFRRLFCTHMAQGILQEKYHGNDSVCSIQLILKLINTDYKSREKERFEYFLSYLKCISRPFLVFHKAIKEAVFDIMLILLDAVVCKKKVRQVIKGIEADKPYLTKHSLMIEFNKLDREILQDADLSDVNKVDLVKLLMKQLTELKSNYIIRPEKMDSIFGFFADHNAGQFNEYYMTLIDRLVGASSDTNKSLWLDDMIVNYQFKHVPLDFRVWLLLENTRTIRDGIEKLYKQIYDESVVSEEFRNIKDAINCRIDDLREAYDYKRSCKMFNDFKAKYRAELDEYRISEHAHTEMAYNTERRIERFLRSLPKLDTLSIEAIINDSKSAKNSWITIFDYCEEEIEEEFEEIKRKQGSGQNLSGLLKWIISESDVYQFGNFHQLLTKEGYLQNSELSETGVNMISGCIKMLDLCRNKEIAILDKVKLLAILFRIVLNAQKVQFIIENKADSNLDEWRHNIEQRYNRIVEGIKKLEGGDRVGEIHIEDKKHYLVIVEREESEDSNTEISFETEALIESLDSGTENYIIDIEYGAVLWKLENEQRSIWVNIENDEWKTEQPEDKMKIAKNVRKIMMFYQELVREIFNPENEDYINEISRVSKRLNIYNSNKVYTHTKEFARAMLFEQAKYYFKGEADSEKYTSNYPSYVLKLLADINISQYYRYGLREKFYYNDSGINPAAKWSDFAELINDGQEFRYCINLTETVNIRLNVTHIDNDDEMLCKNSPDAIRELNMLLFALILNAAEQDRGKRQNSDIQSEQGYVILNIYKEEGYLVIKNECESDVDVEEIKRKLQHIPDSENDGISLWSFNCYIRQCINSLILARLKEIEGYNVQNPPDLEEVKEVGKWIMRLISRDYEIQLENKRESEDKPCFKVKLPIFMEKIKRAGREIGYE